MPRYVAFLRAVIEAHLQKALSFAVPTLIRTTAEVAAAAARTLCAWGTGSDNADSVASRSC